jgi:hypothetical protein
MVIFPGGEDNSDNFAGLKLIPTPDTDSAVCVIVRGHMQSVSKYASLLDMAGYYLQFYL